ncbi:MAG: hypothetical protein K5927_00335 [Lachnospiraceae bacterium]|nr:hypothetical protein [Lachnospiraceae bacterium]
MLSRIITGIRYGCGRLQGYFYGKPMTLDDILAKIADGTYVLSDKFI